MNERLGRRRGGESLNYGSQIAAQHDKNDLLITP